MSAAPGAVRPDLVAVRRAVNAVADPELPAVTIGMLGMVHDVTAEGDDIRVELLPTYSGCPATEMIERDVAAAVSRVPGTRRVTVRFRFDPPWTPDRIDAVGRERLREFGITPPGGPISGSVRPEGRPTLPVAQLPRPCPYCGSTDTVLDSAYGPTPCRDVRFCDACQQPFEAFRAS